MPPPQSRGSRRPLLGQQLIGAVLEQVEIFVGGHAGVGEKGARLLKRQGEIAELLGDAAGLDLRSSPGRGS